MSGFFLADFVYVCLASMVLSLLKSFSLLHFGQGTSLLKSDDAMRTCVGLCALQSYFATEMRHIVTAKWLTIQELYRKTTTASTPTQSPPMSLSNLHPRVLGGTMSCDPSVFSSL